MYENIGTCTCLPVFSPFSAPFYPPLHHNGKAMSWLTEGVETLPASCLSEELFSTGSKLILPSLTG